MALVRTELDSRGVFTVTLADPDNKNALGRQLTSELIAAVGRVAEDPSIRLAVLTNEGSTFCAGADLRERSRRSEVDDSSDPDPLALFRGILDSPKPWVGAIAGHAVAGGLGLAAAVDISIMDEAAKSGFTEVRVGVAPAMISVICLPKMTAGRAADAMLRGYRFSGADAATMGLITTAVPRDQIDLAVDEVVTDLLLAGPEALTATKQLLRRVPNLEREEAFGWTSDLSAERFESAEAAEGMAAFRERRAPSWTPSTD